jgi:hypothetical protein
MTDAASLHCPNCGAPAGPADQTCKYCHGALAKVSCARCFAAMFDGMAYCPACGARRAATTTGDRKARCSACFGVMREVQIGDTGLMECEKCHATWIDSATFEHICADRGAQTAVLQKWTQPPAVAPGEVKYRRCVACGKMMNRLNFGKVSGTIVDVCKGHGTFLDAGELHLIAAFIQGGGLDRARERQLDEMKEEEARLRAMQEARDGGSSQSVQFSMTSSTWTGVDLLKLLDHIGKRQA